MQIAYFILGLTAFAFSVKIFNKWIDKVELEREYLQNLLREQEKDKYILRKGR